MYTHMDQSGIYGVRNCGKFISVYQHSGVVICVTTKVFHTMCNIVQMQMPETLHLALRNNGRAVWYIM
jgi:hypothetical protein